jgi:hypothetical protein
VERSKFAAENLQRQENDSFSNSGVSDTPFDLLHEELLPGAGWGRDVCTHRYINIFTSI